MKLRFTFGESRRSKTLIANYIFFCDHNVVQKKVKSCCILFYHMEQQYLNFCNF